MDAPFELSFNPTSWGPAVSMALPEDALNAAASKSDRLYLFVNFLTDQRGNPKKPAAAAPAAGGAGSPSTEPGTPVTPAVDDTTGFVVKDSVGPVWRPHHGPRPAKPFTPRPPGAQSGPPRQPFRANSGMIDKTSKTRPREPSVQVGEAWELLEQFDMPGFSKLAASVPAVEDLKWTGRLAAYDDKIDKVTASKPKPLVKSGDKLHLYTRVSEDPVIQEFASEGTAKVFATDAVLAHLMAGAKALYPWDIIFTYVGGIIFIDVRDQDKFERLTVHETANKQPLEDGDPLNSASALSDEATRAHQNYTQQVLLASDTTPAGAGASLLKMPVEPSPFWNPAEHPGKAPASVAYRYRKWALGEDGLIVRSVINAADVPRRRLLTTFALTEWDHKDARAVSGSLPWRASLDTRKGQVTSSEIRNNNAKFARWMIQTMLSGADEMRVGFVSRTLPTSRDGHVVLGTQSFTPSNASQMFSLSQTNMWGVIRWAVDLVKTHAAAKAGDTPLDEHLCKFILVKDPNRAVVSLYNIPFDLFEPAGEEEEGEAAEAEEK